MALHITCENQWYILLSFSGCYFRYKTQKYFKKVFIWPLFTFSQIAYNKQLHNFLIYKVKKTSIKTTCGNLKDQFKSHKKWKFQYNLDIYVSLVVSEQIFRPYTQKLNRCQCFVTVIFVSPSCKTNPHGKSLSCKNISQSRGEGVRIINKSVKVCKDTTNTSYIWGCYHTITNHKIYKDNLHCIFHK